MMSLRNAGRSALLVALGLAVFLATAPAEPVAKVNGTPIDQSQLYEYMLKRYGFGSLSTILTAEVVRQEAQKKGVTVTDQELDAQIAKTRTAIDRTAIRTGATFDYFLASRRQTPEMYREAELTLMLLRKMVQDQVKVTDESVRDYYQKNQKNFFLEEGMRVSYIRFDDAKKATEIRQNIVAGHVTFADAARQFSTDPFTKDTGGKLNEWLSRGPTPFLEAAFQLLQDGDRSEIIAFPGLGLYLIQRDQYVRNYQLDFDDVKSDLKNVMIDEMSTNLIKAKQIELMRAAKLEILVKWPEGSLVPPKPEADVPPTPPNP